MSRDLVVFGLVPCRRRRGSCQNAHGAFRDILETAPPQLPSSATSESAAAAQSKDHETLPSSSESASNTAEDGDHTEASCTTHDSHDVEAKAAPKEYLQRRIQSHPIWQSLSLWEEALYRSAREEIARVFDPSAQTQASAFSARGVSANEDDSDSESVGPPGDATGDVDEEIVGISKDAAKTAAEGGGGESEDSEDTRPPSSASS